MRDALGDGWSNRRVWGSLHFENIATDIQTKKCKESSIWGEDYTYIIYIYLYLHLYSHKN